MKKYFILIGLVSFGCFLFIKASLVNASIKNANDLEIETSSAVENRCGWFINPTPSNAWLNDKDAEWVIGMQGGYQAEGDYPAFKDSQWVNTNGNYGYGCACIKGKFNFKTKEVIQIISSKVKPLSVCRKDKTLKKP